MPLSPLFQTTAFSDLPGWTDDDHLAAFQAFRRSAFQALKKPYRSGALGVHFNGFAAAYADSRETPAMDRPGARAFFERHFVPALVSPLPPHPASAPLGHPLPVGERSLGAPAPNTATGQKSAPVSGTSSSPRRGEGGLRSKPGEGEFCGFVTGFYEPVVDASPVRTDRFTVPLLSRPADLIDVHDTNRPAGMDPYLAFARRTPAGPIEYFDRAAIVSGALAGQGLEIAWLADKVDAFFIQVQGAARLTMTDGRVMRITYAAKSGQRFSGPGKILADLGEIPLEQVTMQSIRAWFKANPDRIDEILWQNRSYVFFREAAVDDPALGPIAAAKVPLTPGRSVAVDRLLHTFGTPFYIDAPALTAFGGNGFRRLMIAQDTGSAITGPARGDLFAGSGDAAGEIAGVVRDAADFYALLPKRLVGSETA